MVAPSWSWIIFANVLLGINQGLCWSTTVIMKIDLVGPARRGLAMGLNEAAGYLAVSLAALGAGYLAATYALRPQPFVLGLVFAVAGLLLSLFFVRESQGHAIVEAKQHAASTSAGQITPLGPTPYFVLIERALRDEGTSYHYLPPARYSQLEAARGAACRSATWPGRAGCRRRRSATMRRLGCSNHRPVTRTTIGAMTRPPWSGCASSPARAGSASPWPTLADYWPLEIVATPPAGRLAAPVQYGRRATA